MDAHHGVAHQEYYAVEPVEVISPVGGAAFDLAETSLTIALVEPRQLTRECVLQSLRAARRQWTVQAFASIEDWRGAAAPCEADLVLLSDRALAGDLAGGIRKAMLAGEEVPVILLSDREDGEGIRRALESGARGYIGAGVTLKVAIEAIQLVRAGGTYVPPAGLHLWGQPAGGQTQASAAAQFSRRQTAVLKALREGKANKTIAYELAMQESTVKVHVRTIMRKVNARNRTEVAYKTRDLFV